MRTVLSEEEARSEGTTYEDSEDDVQQTQPATAESRRETIDAERLMNRNLEEMSRVRDLIHEKLEMLRIERENVRLERESVTRETNMYVPRPSISALGELINEFSGAKDTFWKWERQFELVRRTYQLNDRMARILMGTKLKNKALEWFHSRPKHLEFSVDKLTEKMRSIFYY